MESPRAKSAGDAAPTLPMRTSESPLLLLNFAAGDGAHCRTFSDDPRGQCAACGSGRCSAFPVQDGQWACVVGVRAREVVPGRPA